MANQTVLITGASRGIGASCARVFAKAGWNVALLARSEDAIADLAAEVGNSARAIPCDVSEPIEMARAAKLAVETFGRLDAAILNAGILEPIAPLADAEPDAWGRTIDVNLKGVFYGFQAVLPVLEQGGTVITVSSGAAHNPYEGWSSYCASKAGAWMVTRSAYLEYGERFRIFGLSPGTVATQMQRDIKASGIGPVAALDWEDHIPPEWPARACLWMCGPEADPLQGTELRLRDAALRARIGLT